MTRIVSSLFHVSGVEDDRDVKKALQSLYDAFATEGLGQATFEIVDGEPTRLWVKHKDTAEPSRELIDGLLAEAGDYRTIDE